MKTTQEAKTYYYVGRDHNGQKTGHYHEIKLTPDQIDTSRGYESYKGRYLYSSYYEVLIACQD